MSHYTYLINEVPQYNQPNKERQEFVRDWATKHKFKKLLDVGCGKGNYMKALKEFKIQGVDPYSNDKSVIPKSILEFKPTKKYDAFYCLDVLEHIDKPSLDENLKALSKFAPVGLLGIANHSDVWDGVELHLIQEGSGWWGEILSKYFTVKLLEDGDRYFMFEVSNV